MKIPDEMLSKGEEIVRHWWPKYKSGQWQERLAEQINEALQSSTPDIVRELADELLWVKETIEMDFMLDGEWVDNPTLMIRSIHEEATKILAKYSTIKGARG